MSHSPLDNLRSQALEAQVIEVLRTVFDPELPINIYDLGLIYGIEADPAEGKVHVKMTLTSPACPVAGALPADVQKRIESIPEVSQAQVELVWDPPWSPARMSEAAKLQLNLGEDDRPSRAQQFFDIGRR